MQKIPGIITSLALIGGMIFLRARTSYSSFDFQSSNFAFFWLAGRMILQGESPYNQAQYLAGHEVYGIKWQPNKIFPYPLPLAVLCAPLGFLSLQNAYVVWQVISLIIVALIIYILLNRWDSTAPRRMLIPIFGFMFLFGPLYLTLHTGSLGAFAAIAIVCAILLLDADKPLHAGIVLSLTILKPPQGLMILLLAGVWLFARRDWKAFYGMAIGGLALLIVGMVLDPLWLIKFRTAGQAVMDRTQGVHSNVWALSYLACKGSSPCSTLLGAVSSVILLGLGGLFLWRNQAKLSAWEAMNIILPIGFVSTIYLWAYDQLPYLIPIVWIVGSLVKQTKSYVHAFIFLIVLDLVSLIALSQLANTKKDLWSLGTTALVLFSCLPIWYRQAYPRSIQTRI